MIEYIVATDGGITGASRGQGQIAYIIQVCDDKQLIAEQTYVGAVGFLTNNSAELKAIYEGIHACTDLMPLVEDAQPKDVITLYSDSLLAINWIQGRFQINKAHIQKEVDAIRALISDTNVEIIWQHVKGHTRLTEESPLGYKLNALADRMIREFRGELDSVDILPG